MTVASYLYRCLWIRANTRDTWVVSSSELVQTMVFESFGVFISAVDKPVLWWWCFYLEIKLATDMPGP